MKAQEKREREREREREEAREREREGLKWVELDEVKKRGG